MIKKEKFANNCPFRAIAVGVVCSAILVDMLFGFCHGLALFVGLFYVSLRLLSFESRFVAVSSKSIHSYSILDFGCSDRRGRQRWRPAGSSPVTANPEPGQRITPT